MAISLNNLRPFDNSKVAKKRVGRGNGSKWGTTAGRGSNGQKSRSGVGGLKRLGMKKLVLSTPKMRGFQSLATKPAVVNIEDLAKHFTKGGMVTVDALKALHLIPSSHRAGVKVLGTGAIDVAITIKGCTVSKSAADKITAAGGQIKA